MSLRRLATALSITLCFASLLALAVVGLNFGLDFTGGTLVEVTFDQPVSANEVRTDLAARGLAEAAVQQSGSERQLVVRIPARADEETSQVVDELLGALKQAHPGVRLERADYVGPAVGEELRESGILALLMALIVTGIYIAWRFTGKFAAAATIALAHDVIITAGAFSLFRWKFDLPSLAAILTVIGYSLNDTIVICDRIRENLRAMRKSTVTGAINRSLNQTLERTLIMSGTKHAVQLALLIFGGPELRGFAAAHTVGGVVGNYSTINVAAAYLVYAGLAAADLVIEVDGEESP
jgi:preprotein translocase subunit SecF